MIFYFPFKNNEHFILCILSTNKYLHFRWLIFSWFSTSHISKVVQLTINLKIKMFMKNQNYYFVITLFFSFIKYLTCCALGGTGFRVAEVGTPCGMAGPGDEMPESFYWLKQHEPQSESLLMEMMEFSDSLFSNCNLLRFQLLPLIDRTMLSVFLHFSTLDHAESRSFVLPSTTHIFSPNNCSLIQESVYIGSKTMKRQKNDYVICSIDCLESNKT